MNIRIDILRKGERGDYVLSTKRIVGGLNSMKIIINSNQKNNPLEKEPYKTLIKHLRTFEGSYKDESITLGWPYDTDTIFQDGFYIGNEDDIKQVPHIDYIFTELSDNGSTKEFVRCIHSNKFSRNNYSELIFDRVHNISLRLPYVYIPNVESFEAECTLSDKVIVTMDAVVSDKKYVEDVCCLMLSHMITIFSLDD